MEKMMESSASQMLRGWKLDGKKIMGIYKTGEKGRLVLLEKGGQAVLTKNEVAMLAKIIGTTQQIQKYVKSGDQERKKMEENSLKRQEKIKANKISQVAEEAKGKGMLDQGDINKLKELLDIPIGNIYRLEVPFSTKEDNALFKRMLGRLS